MQIIKSFIALVLVVVTFQISSAQTVTSSTKQLISSKANKGGLYHFKVDEESNEVRLTYLLKKKKGFSLTETYVFDRNTLEFKTSTEQEEDLEKLRPSKGSKVLRVFPAMSGQIKLQLGHISYSHGVGVTGTPYTLQKFIKEKEVKPKGEDGDRILYVMHQSFESDNERIKFYGNEYNLNVGDIQILGVVNAEPLYTKYEVMVYDAKNLNTKNRNTIDLPYSYRAVSGKVLPNGNMAMVLKPFTMKDIPNPKASKGIIEKYKLAPDYKFRYVEVDPSGKVIHNVEISMKEPESGWSMSLEIISQNGSDVMITGSLAPLNIKGPPLKKIFGPHSVMNEGPRSIITPKATHFVVSKIKNGTEVYFKDYTWESIIKSPVSNAWSADVVPSSMKKYLKYDWFAPVDLIHSNGKDILVFQKNNLHTHLMQLNADNGAMEANYFVSPEKKRVLSSASGPRVLINSKGEIHLLVYQQVEEKDENAEKQQKALGTLKVHIIKLDPENKSLGEPVDISPDGNLNPEEGVFMLNSDQFITLAFGRKKEIILSKVQL